MALCVSCGRELKEGARFCPYCGAGQSRPSASNAPEPPVPPAPVSPAVPVPPAAPAPPLPSGKKKSRAPLIIGIVAGAAVIVSGLVLLFIFVLLPRFSGAAPEVSDDALYGRYYAVSATVLDQNAATDGEWMELEKGGNGTFYVSGKEHTLTWDLEEGVFSGSVTFLGLKNVITGTLEDGILRIEYGIYSYVMSRDGKVPDIPETETETASEPASEPVSEPESGSETEEDPQLDLDLIAGYEGDWYGAVQFSNCSGAYKDHDFALTDAIMRLSFFSDGSVTPYLRLNLAGFEARSGFDSSSETNNFPDLEARLDPDSGSLFLYGHFFSGSLGDATRAVLNRNGSLTISATVTADDGSFDLLMIFRRPDGEWSDEDSIRLTEEGAAYYRELGLAEIAKEFGLDPARIPEMTELADYQKEGAPLD